MCNATQADQITDTETQIANQAAQIADLQAKLTASTTVLCHTLDDNGVEVVEERIQRLPSSTSVGGGGDKKRESREWGDGSRAAGSSALGMLHGTLLDLKRVKKEKDAVEVDLDDEVDERQIAYKFIEKLKDDMDKLRKQVTDLGERPVL